MSKLIERQYLIEPKIVIYGGYIFINYQKNTFKSTNLFNNKQYFVYPVSCSHYANIVSNQIQASITCLLFLLIYDKRLLLTLCSMISNQNIYAITT